MFSFRNDPGADGVGVAFTDRLGGSTPGTLGSLNLGRTDVDQLSLLRANLAAVRAAIGVVPFVTVNQIHGTDVLDVDQAFLADWGEDSWLGGSVRGAARLRRADAMVTTVSGVALAIRVADCLPVLLADATAGVIGAAHAGRVGLAAGVLPAVVARLTELGAGQLTAWIGPHICGACYEVPGELQQEFAQQHPGAVATTSWGTPSLDLGAAAEQQLAALGVSVRRADPCTLTTESLHSYRRDGADSGRQVGVIWLP